MHFEEIDRHDFRIYAGACEVPGGGFTAGVAVRRIRGSGLGELPMIYREDELAGGHRWAAPAEALRYAIGRGVTAVEQHRTRPAVVTG